MNTTRGWQLGDVGQQAYEPVDRRTVFAPPSRVSPILEAAPSTAIDPVAPLPRRSVMTYSAGPRYGECDEPGCGTEFRGPPRGRMPTKCPEHRRSHQRRSDLELVRDIECCECHVVFHHKRDRGVFPKRCPRCRQPRAHFVPVKGSGLGAALISCVESGGLVWKTKLGDYLVMRGGREYHGDTLAGAIARSCVETAPQQDREDAADREHEPVLRQSA